MTTSSELLGGRSLGSDPGQKAKFDAGAPNEAAPNLGELPLAYRDNRLHLSAIRPQQLFAYWGLAPEQRDAAWYAQSNIYLRLIDLDNPAEHWDFAAAECVEYFIETPRPGARYRAELGYIQSESFVTVMASAELQSPSVDPQPTSTPRFVTLPQELSIPELRQHAAGAAPLADALYERGWRGILPIDGEGRLAIDLPLPSPAFQAMLQHPLQSAGSSHSARK